MIPLPTTLPDKLILIFRLDDGRAHVTGGPRMRGVGAGGVPVGEYTVSDGSHIVLHYIGGGLVNVDAPGRRLISMDVQGNVATLVLTKP